MKRPASTQRKRPVYQITLGRASRLYRLVSILEIESTAREAILDRLEIGLRTFYRELDLLKKCGIKLRRDGKTYALTSTMADAEARLPFPDPHLSFAEMAELARLPGETALRLAEIYRGVVEPPPPKPKRRARGRKRDG